MGYSANRKRCSRRAAAAVELAILLPFLTFMFVIAIDYSRVFYYSLTVENAARSGALYASASGNNALDTAGISNAALADAGNITPTPTVSSLPGIDKDGHANVAVTVNYTFKTITKYPGIPSSVNLSSTVSMRILP